MKKIIITIGSLLILATGWLFWQRPEPPFGAIQKTQIEIAQDCIATPKRVHECIGTLNANDRASIKSAEIAKLNHVGTFDDTKYGLRIEIQSLKAIEVNGSHGVELFARAWKNGQPIGFGDGTVEIERFRVFNPPILVDDPLGSIERITQGTGGKSDGVRKLREDPIEAIKQTLAHTISLVGKQDTQIIKSSVGNTTSTFYPDAGTGTAADGTAGWSGSDTAFATVRAHVGNAVNPDVNAAKADDVVNNYLLRLLNGATDFNQLRQMNRALYSFSTGALGTDTIDSATFSIAAAGSTTIDGVNATNNSAVLDKVTPTNANNVVATDFDITRWATVEQSSNRILYDNWAANTVYMDWTLNATGRGNINKSGITSFGLRDSIDFDNTGLSGNTGTVQDGGNGYFADQAGTTSDPKLVVVHSVAAGGAGQLIEE